MWTWPERVRTHAVVPLQVDLVDLDAQPRYQVIAEEALRLRRLGWSYRKLGRHFRIDAAGVRKAVAWALEFDPVGRSLQEPPRPGCKHQRISRDALEMFENGKSMAEIADRFGVSHPTVVQAIGFARAGGDPDQARPFPDQIREDALRLRKKGWSFEQIGVELGVSRETARLAVRKAKQTKGGGR